ncbi:MAG: hypothetical protein NVS1B4_06910 [Gemmatimonadaceae bacterium]
MGLEEKIISPDDDERGLAEEEAAAAEDVLLPHGARFEPHECVRDARDESGIIDHPGCSPWPRPEASLRPLTGSLAPPIVERLIAHSMD